MICFENFISKLINQLSFFNFSQEELVLDKHTLMVAKERTVNCLKHVNNKYITNELLESEVGFNPNNSLQYAVFLYYLGNTYYNNFGDNIISTLTYQLNKQINNIELYYNRKMPDYWFLEHPLGSIIGNASYSNGILIYQGVTIGSNKGDIRPTFYGNCVLYTNSTILGDCKVGRNVIISANSYIKEMDIPDNSIVFGESPNLIIKQKTEEYMKIFFEKLWR